MFEKIVDCGVAGRVGRMFRAVRHGHPVVQSKKLAHGNAVIEGSHEGMQFVEVAPFLEQAGV